MLPVQNKPSLEMEKTYGISLVFLLLFAGQPLGSQSQTFPINGRDTRIVCLTEEHPLYLTAAGILAEDIEKVTGHRPEILTGLEGARGNVILVGNIESEMIKPFTGEGSEFSRGIRGKWETYGLKIMENAGEGIDRILLIAGSDPRGTAYGVMDVSRKIGVSPWEWWADVRPEKREEVQILQPEFVSQPPSVRFRGIFLNDEDWGLQPWAARTYDPATGDIGPPTYAKIFELLLRLRANLIWPAMHDCTRAFFQFPGNPRMALKYGIVIGSSHAEPMLRNNVDEWDPREWGDYNYSTNREGVYAYWEERAEQSRGIEAVYTMGMRGIHDSGIMGYGNTKERVSALEEIIGDQREILAECVNPDVTAVPQAFIPYKEVLEIYDAGLRLPADITVVWPDDNYGYIRRLSNPTEQERPGGSGVYYHVSYWGRPHDYLWLNSTHPVMIWEEMTRAWNSGARNIWVLNVGDIRPCEYPMQLFLDMAYNMGDFPGSGSVWKHHKAWMEEIFPGSGREITEIFRDYYRLAFERKPEFTGWNQVEKQTVVSFSDYNHYYYGDEAGKRIQACRDLLEKVGGLPAGLSSERKDAFFSLVRYPVSCAAWMNLKWLSLEKAYLYARQGRSSAGEYARKAGAAYDSISRLTGYYNQGLSGGKWEGIMSMAPRDLPVFDKPLLPSWTLADESGFEICLEGYEGQAYREEGTMWNLPRFYRGSGSRYFMDVYLKGEGPVEWNAVTSGDWIRVSSRGGVLGRQTGVLEERVLVWIDEEKLPDRGMVRGEIRVSGGGKTRRIAVSVHSAPGPGRDEGDLFAEMNGYVSIWAEHFSETRGAGWQVVGGPGYTGAVLAYGLPGYHDIGQQAQSTMGHRYRNDEPVRSASGSPANSHDPVRPGPAPEDVTPCVDYVFHSQTKGKCTVRVYCLPTHPVDNRHELRLSVRVDGGEGRILNFRTRGRSEQWKLNVLSNTYMLEADFNLPEAGRHVLTLEAMDPAILIDRLEIDLGGLKNAYSAVPETRISQKHNEP